MKKIIPILAMLLFFSVTLFISNRFGYRSGFADRALLGIPGDLIMQLQMHSMSTKFSDNVLPSLLKEDAVKLHLYSTLHMLDQHYDRVIRLQDQHLGVRFYRESFDKNVIKAKKIVEDFEVMTLGDALEARGNWGRTLGGIGVGP